MYHICTTMFLRLDTIAKCYYLNSNRSYKKQFSKNCTKNLNQPTVKRPSYNQNNNLTTEM